MTFFVARFLHILLSYGSLRNAPGSFLRLFRLNEGINGGSFAADVEDGITVLIADGALTHKEAFRVVGKGVCKAFSPSEPVNVGHAPLRIHLVETHDVAAVGSQPLGKLFRVRLFREAGACVQVCAPETEGGAVLKNRAFTLRLQKAVLSCRLFVLEEIRNVQRRHIRMAGEGNKQKLPCRFLCRAVKQLVRKITFWNG